MDYDNPQFIAAVKKILRDITEEVHQSPPTEQPTENADVKEELTTPSVRTFHVSDSLIDRIKRQSTHEERHEWRKDFLEMAMVGIVLVYAFFTWLQWKELNTSNLNQSAANISSGATADRTLLQGREALRQTQQSFETQQRAWVGAEFILVNPRPIGTPDNLIPFQLTWKNTGPTPAVKASVMRYFSYQDRDYLIESDFARSNTKRIPRPGPKLDSLAVVAPSGGIGFTPIYYIPVPRPNKRLFVIGEITYDDVFGHHHLTEVCNLLETDVQPNILPYCNIHNSMN